MVKKDINPIRVDTTVPKDLPSVSNYFDTELGEIPGVESVIKDMSRKEQSEAEKIVKRYEKNGIKTI